MDTAIENSLLRMCEEANEVIQESLKGIRFGLYNFHPGDKNQVPNHRRIFNEIQQLKAQIETTEWLLSSLNR